MEFSPIKQGSEYANEETRAALHAYEEVAIGNAGTLSPTLIYHLSLSGS